MGFRIRAAQGLISMPVGEIKCGVVADAIESSRYVHRNQPCTPSASAISLFRVARDGHSTPNPRSFSGPFIVPFQHFRSVGDSRLGTGMPWTLRGEQGTRRARQAAGDAPPSDMGI